MSEELKARSFRMTDEITEKFRAICSDFPNQNIAMESLINAYEAQNATVVLTDRQTDISDYNCHIQALQSAFLHSLELNEGAEARIRQEFQRQLTSKEQTIQDLQERVRAAELTAQTAQEQVASMEHEMNVMNEELANQIDSISTELKITQKTLATAQEQITDKQALLDESRKQLAQAQLDREQLAEFETRAITAEQAQRQAEALADELKRQSEQNRKEAEQATILAKEHAEIEKEKAILAEREKNSAKIQDLTEKNHQLYEELNCLRQELLQAERKFNKQTEKKD